MTATALHRRLALPAVLAGLAVLAGCRGGFPLREDDGLGSMPAPPREFDKDELVAHLNTNIQKLHGWQSSDVKITARQEGNLMDAKLSAMLAVESPRNFRLRAKSLLRGEETDFGSNDDHFWFWMRESPQPVIFKAPHDAVHVVQERMRIPFDPGWLMESLGVIPIDPTLVSLQRYPEAGVVDLFEERIIANGQRVKLATTVHTGSFLVVGRTLYDPQGEIVARATISGHRVHEPDGEHGGIILPRHVKLEWPNARTTLEIEIGRVEVNPVIEIATWTMPEIPGCEIVELRDDRRHASLPSERRIDTGGLDDHPFGAPRPDPRPGESEPLDFGEGREAFEPPVGHRPDFESPITRPVSFQTGESSPIDGPRRDRVPAGASSGSSSGEPPLWEFEN